MRDNGVGVDQLLKLDQHGVKHKLLTSGRHAVPVAGEPGLQVVLVPGQITGRAAHIYRLRGRSHDDHPEAASPLEVVSFGWDSGDQLS